MSPYQSIFATAALSLPIVTLIAIGRGILCLFRSQKAKHLKFVIFSSLGIVLMFGLFAAVVVAWFVYAVAHTGKDASTDLVLLASTGIPIYAGAFAIWRLSGYMERKLKKDGT